MKKQFYILLLPLLLTNCEKNISYSSSSLWKKQPQNNDYNSEVFINQNKNNSYNNNQYQNQQYQEQQYQQYQNKQYNNQENSKQYQNDRQVYNQNYGQYNNQQPTQKDNQPINIYITNPQQQQNDHRQQDRNLMSEIDKSMGNNVHNSALFEEGKRIGQIELSSREQFNTKAKQKVKYSIEPNNKQNIQQENLANQIKKEIQNQVKNEKKYRIQCGNYANEEYAQVVVEKLKNAGIKDVQLVSENGTHRILVGSFNSKNEGSDVFEKILGLNLKDNIFWKYQ